MDLSPAPALGFHHGAASVPDLEAAILWYRDVLGFEVEQRVRIEAAGADVAMLIRGPLRVELFEVAGAAPLPDDRRTPHDDLRTHGTKHFAFRIADLDAFLIYLEGKNADIAMVVRESFARVCFVRDCAGNLVEFVEMPV